MDFFDTQLTGCTLGAHWVNFGWHWVEWALTGEGMNMVRVLGGYCWINSQIMLMPLGQP
jgi:hypothetical protein